MYTYARKASRAIWRVSMDQRYPDALDVSRGCRRGLLADRIGFVRRGRGVVEARSAGVGF